MKNNTTAVALVVLAIVFALLGILYAVGAINFLTTVKPHHYSHAALMFVLAVGCLVGASFARPGASSR